MGTHINGVCEHPIPQFSFNSSVYYLFLFCYIRSANLSVDIELENPCGCTDGAPSRQHHCPFVGGISNEVEERLSFVYSNPEVIAWSRDSLSGHASLRKGLVCP